jgi:hypothetical protein
MPMDVQCICLKRAYISGKLLDGVHIKVLEKAAHKMAYSEGNERIATADCNALADSHGWQEARG